MIRVKCCVNKKFQKPFCPLWEPEYFFVSFFYFKFSFWLVFSKIIVISKCSTKNTDKAGFNQAFCKKKSRTKAKKNIKLFEHLDFSPIEGIWTLKKTYFKITLTFILILYCLVIMKKRLKEKKKIFQYVKVNCVLRTVGNFSKNKNKTKL